MGDVVESMLARSMEVMKTNDEVMQAEIERTDDVVDNLNQAIKLYLTRVSREDMSEGESRRCTEIISFVINLEHIGDIVDKSLMDLAGKKIKNDLRFSEEGFQDIMGLHRQLLENIRLAFGVFMTGNADMARQLLVEKDRFRDRERLTSERHLHRLRSRKTESVETSAIHLDILNAFKRINSHLTSVAYPVLEQTGKRFSRRLTKRA